MLDCKQEDGLRRFALEESKHVLKMERIIRHKMKRLDKINNDYTIVFKGDCLDSFKELSRLNPKNFHLLFSDWDSRHHFAHLIEFSSNGRPRLVGGGSTETQRDKMADLREQLQQYFISLTDLDHPVKPYDITSIVSVNGDTMSQEIRKTIKQGFKIKKKQIESLKPCQVNALPVTPMTTMTTTRSMKLREVTPFTSTSTSKYFMEQSQPRQNNSQNDLSVEDLRGCIKDKIKEMKMALSHLRKQAGHASDCRERINRLDNKSQPENQDKSMTLRSSASKNSPAKSSPPNRSTRSSTRQSAKSRESIVAVPVSFGKEIDLRSDRQLGVQGVVRGPLETYWLDLIRQGMELTKK